jgi:hypothetical protein
MKDCYSRLLQQGVGKMQQKKFVGTNVANIGVTGGKVAEKVLETTPVGSSFWNKKGYSWLWKMLVWKLIE